MTRRRRAMSFMGRSSSARPRVGAGGGMGVLAQQPMVAEAAPAAGRTATRSKEHSRSASQP
ncbi:hypothetical protein ABT269_32490 [Streptomyces viridosporus]|uniref:hypothetical protein n=1 Tax=Streptomyces viridosporus TaxID=67581 RepID=UPI00331B2924